MTYSTSLKRLAQDLGMGAVLQDKQAGQQGSVRAAIQETLQLLN